MNIPNRLTVLRIIMVPFFVFFLLMQHGENYTFRMIALAIFVVASFTDFLDGFLARKYNLITNFGKFMDPLADKLLVCSALICLVELNQIPAYIVIIVIAREFIISGFRLVASDQNIVIAASYWGKFKTVSQMITIILLILNISQLKVVSDAMIIIMMALTVISLCDYLLKNKSVLTSGGM